VPTGLLADFQKSPALGVRAAPRFSRVVPPCATAPDQAQAGILPAGPGIGPVETQGALVIEQQSAGLQLYIRSQRRDGAQAGRPAVKPRADRSGHALAVRRGPEPLPAIPPARNHGKTAAKAWGERGGELALAPVIDQC
jgi:hypothetical protein